MTPGSPSENLIFELLWGSQSRNSRAGRPVKSVCSPADPHSDPSRYPPSESAVTAAARGKALQRRHKQTEQKNIPSCHFGEHIVCIIQMGRVGSRMATPMLAKHRDPADAQRFTRVTTRSGLFTPAAAPSCSDVEQKQILM